LIEERPNADSPPWLPTCGYSGLMEQDEAGTMVALAERRKAVWEPLLAKYRGRAL